MSVYDVSGVGPVGPGVGAVLCCGLCILQCDALKLKLVCVPSSLLPGASTRTAALSCTTGVSKAEVCARCWECQPAVVRLRHRDRLCSSHKVMCLSRRTPQHAGSGRPPVRRSWCRPCWMTGLHTWSGTRCPTVCPLASWRLCLAAAAADTVVCPSSVRCVRSDCLVVSRIAVVTLCR